MNITEEMIEKAYEAYWKSRGNNLVRIRAALESVAADIEARARREGMETQATINAWADQVGITADAVRSVRRAAEEMREAVDEANRGDFDKAAVELADVVICAFVAAQRMGKDLQSEIDAKMKINRARKWRVDATGAAYHVRAAAPATESRDGK